MWLSWCSNGRSLLQGSRTRWRLSRAEAGENLSPPFGSSDEDKNIGQQSGRRGFPVCGEFSRGVCELLVKKWCDVRNIVTPYWLLGGVKSVVNNGRDRSEKGTD